MFFALGHFWHFVVDSWHAPRRARLLYIAFATGFLALAIAGAVKGDALVAVISALFGAATAVLAVFAPKLSSWTRLPLPSDQKSDV